MAYPPVTPPPLVKELTNEALKDLESMKDLQHFDQGRSSKKSRASY